MRIIHAKHGISDATFYKWRAKYAGLEVSDVKKLRQLEDENRRLKQMVGEQALDIRIEPLIAKILDAARTSLNKPITRRQHAARQVTEIAAF
jgi:hypothetical protein